MIARFWSVVATVTLLTLVPGCSGMRDFLFGRGARCGLCNRFSQPAPAPQPPASPCQSAQPYASVPCAPQVVSEPCECAPQYGVGYSQHAECGPCGSGVVGESTVDPYLSGGEYLHDGSIPMEGAVIGGQVVPGQIVPGTVLPGDGAVIGVPTIDGVQGSVPMGGTGVDSWQPSQSRRVNRVGTRDDRGDLIISEGAPRPLSAGSGSK